MGRRERMARAADSDRRMAERLAEDPNAPGNPIEAINALTKSTKRFTESLRRLIRALDEPDPPEDEW